MPETFLHGVEVVDIDSGLRPIRTLRLSIIGLVGTAPDADPAVFPYNKPVLMVGREPALQAALGSRGTLPWSLDGIIDQAGATVVIIRVPRAAQPRMSVLDSVQRARVSVAGELLTRASGGDVDDLGNADVIQVSRVYMGSVEYDKGVDWRLENDAIVWITNNRIETVARRLGTTDPLDHADALLAVARVYLGTTEFTAGVDFNVTPIGIEWLGVHPNQPTEHDEYTVLYTWGARPAAGNAFQANYSHYEYQAVTGELVSRAAVIVDYDSLANYDILRVRALYQGATSFVEGVDWELLNNQIHWLRYDSVETLTRVAANTYDALAHGGHVLRVLEVSQGATQYTQGVDFQLSADGLGIEWLAGVEPADGTTYNVSYEYGTRPAPSSDYEVDYDFRVGEVVAMSNLIGGVDPDTGAYTGMYALLAAQSEVKVTPRILIAPGFTHYQAVVTEMLGIADELRAVIIADGPNTTDYDAIGYRENFGSKRVFVVDPWVKFWNTQLGAEDVQTASARVAGMIAKLDEEKGFWWSPSNKEINGILGTSRAISFSMGNRNSRANLLNENEVTTIIHEDGYRLWGNRTCSSDARWAFLSAVRIDDAIEESLKQAMLWAVDRNLTRTFFEEVSASVNAYCRHMASMGAIIIGNIDPCWVDPKLNTPDQLIQGKATFNFDYDRPYPAEHITFNRYINHEYLTTIFDNATFTR